MDTFEEEVIIDIDKVAENLKKLHKDELNLLEKIGEFCKELKINKPF